MNSSNLAAPSLPLPGGDVVLSVSGLSHAYRDRPVLHDFALEVARGEVVGLLGPNGSGKSTVLALTAGLLGLQSGSFALGGVPTRPGSTPLRHALGVVFQSPAVDARLSVRENLELAALMRGLFGPAARRRVDELLALSGLADRQTDVVGKLSGGQRRRVDIARALVHSPRLLLLDEPTTGLDEGAFRDTWARLLALRDATGLAIVVATHRPDEAEMCNRLVVLSGGKTVRITTPEALRSTLHGDIITVTSADATRCAAALRVAFPAANVITQGADTSLTVERGAELIPQVVLALRDGPEPTAISLRRPSLADAFLQLAGERLGTKP